MRLHLLCLVIMDTLLKLSLNNEKDDKKQRIYVSWLCLVIRKGAHFSSEHMSAHRRRGQFVFYLASSQQLRCTASAGPRRRPYPSRSWFSIKRPRKDARLSWPSWLRWYTHPKTVTHPRTNRARRGLTSFVGKDMRVNRGRREYEEEMAIRSGGWCGRVILVR